MIATESGLGGDVMVVDVLKVMDRHLQEWTVESGVDQEITRLNLESLDDPKEIARRLGWQGYHHTPGWWAGGQFKPDVPLQFPDRVKPAKYLTSKAGYDAILLRTPDPDYWEQIAADPSLPIVITEGAKKAGAGLTAGYATIALCGVDMGLRRGRLVPSLARFAVKGRPIILAFDADIVDKSEVRDALVRLAAPLQRRGCIISVAQWELSEGKGLDDLWVASGQEGIDRVLTDPIAYKDWLKRLEGQVSDRGGRNKTDKIPPQMVMAQELAERYRNQLAWDVAGHCWRQYSRTQEGIWQQIAPETLGQLVSADLRARPEFANKGSHGYVNGVIGQLRYDLSVEHWDETPGLLPLQDGVLDLETQQLHEHSPGYRLRWCLPYRWADRVLGCLPILAWLTEAMGGDQTLVELLLAWVAAVVRGRTDLQRYVELMGVAGSGKGTFIRLLEAVIGSENTFTTELTQLETNRFEAAGILGKRLVTITDADHYGGSVGKLKALVGQDTLRLERKGQQQTQGFRPQALVTIAAEQPIQSSDYSGGLKRRRLTIPFTQIVKPENRRDLEREFKPHLAGLLYHCLQISNDRITELIRNTERSIPRLHQFDRQQLTETNPLAAWVDEFVVHRPGATTYVGRKDPDRASSWLYASYCQWCLAIGSTPIGLKRFSPLLEDLCRAQLGWTDVARGRDSTGAHFVGLEFRSTWRPEPRSITEERPDPSPMTVNDGICDGTVTAGTLASVGTDGNDGTSQLLIEKTITEPVKEQPDLEEGTDQPTIPSSPITFPSGQGSQPSDPPITTHHDPSPQPSFPSQSEAQSSSPTIDPPPASQPPSCPDPELQEWQELIHLSLSSGSLAVMESLLKSLGGLDPVEKTCLWASLSRDLKEQLRRARSLLGASSG